LTIDRQFKYNLDDALPNWQLAAASIMPGIGSTKLMSGRDCREKVSERVRKCVCACVCEGKRERVSEVKKIIKNFFSRWSPQSFSAHPIRVNGPTMKGLKS
jgi:hypothetical protein